MDRQRNWLIEAFRFLAAAFIVLFHFEWLYLGFPVYMGHEYIWVEFFFCLSGYFLAKSQMRHPGREPVPYVISRLKKLYPLFAMSFVLNFVLICYNNHYQFSDALLRLWSSKWELLLLNMSGFALPSTSDVIYGGAPEYISALLMASLILCWLISRHEKLYFNVLAPLLVLAFYTRILVLTGNLSQWNYVDQFYTLGFLRAIAGMSLGALSCFWLRPLLDGTKRQMGPAVPFLKGGFLLFSLFMICGLIKFPSIISGGDLVFYVLLFAALLAVCDTLPVGGGGDTAGGGKGRPTARKALLSHVFDTYVYNQSLYDLCSRAGREMDIRLGSCLLHAGGGGHAAAGKRPGAAVSRAAAGGIGPLHNRLKKGSGTFSRPGPLLCPKSLFRVRVICWRTSARNSPDTHRR